MKKIIDFVVARAKERSTWLGLTALLTAVGVGLNPEQVEAIAAAGVGVAGLIAAFTKDAQ